MELHVGGDGVRGRGDGVLPSGDGEREDSVDGERGRAMGNRYDGRITAKRRRVGASPSLPLPSWGRLGMSFLRIMKTVMTFTFLPFTK